MRDTSEGVTLLIPHSILYFSLYPLLLSPPPAVIVGFFEQTGYFVDEDEGAVQVGIGVLSGSLGVNLPLLLATATFEEDTAVGMYVHVFSPY